MNRSSDITPDGFEPDVDQLLQSFSDGDKVGLREAWDLAGNAEVIPPSVSSDVWGRLVPMLAERQKSMAPKLRKVGFLAELRLRAPVRLPALSLVSRLSVAASILLFVVLGYSLWPSTSEYHASQGVSSLEITLRDGSQVSLASGTVLRVPESFGSTNRSVELDGEAFFDITPSSLNEGLPFQVQTFNATIEVMGTAFNVRARESKWEASTTVAVEHGSVRLASAALPDLAVVLEPGEGSRVNAGDTPSTPDGVDLSRSVAWLHGGLAFSNEPMGVVFDELERRYDLEIDASPAIRSVLVSYWRESNVGVDEMLADLADVVDVNFRRTVAGYKLFETDH